MTRKEELKKIIDDAKSELKKLTSVNLFDMVDEKPIKLIRVFDTATSFKSGIEIDMTAGRNWEHMRELAKQIHFADYHGAAMHINGPNPRRVKINNLSRAQIKLSVDLLNEIIPIYNRYIKLANPVVTVNGEEVNPWGDGNETDQ